MYRNVLLTNYYIFYCFCCRHRSVMLLHDVIKLRLFLLLELGAPRWSEERVARVKSHCWKVVVNTLG